jgi:prepilin signal peptidase PulO-like enzyme (type II secretory pathway)
MALIKLIVLWVSGWMAGSLIILMADQLPVYRKLGRPECDTCKTQRGCLPFIFLEPCTNCGSPRNPRSYLVQWIYPLLFITVGFWKPERLLTIEALILVVYFGLILIIDIEHHLILHPVSLSGALIAMVIGIRLHGPLPTVYGGAAGFGLMLALYYFGDLFSRLMARRRGEALEEVALGFGDVNLSGVLGLLLGWPGITAGLVLAILAGGITSGGVILVMLIRKRYQAFTALPYAPFLVFAGAVLLLRP